MKAKRDSTIKPVMRLRLESWASPVSTLLIVADESGLLRALEFAEHEQRMKRLLRRHYGDFTIEEGKAPESITRALRAYFDGDLDALNQVKTATNGTAFQREVWRALRTIPAGTTISYGELASKIGRAQSSRAVGAANGANPIPIVVPCHRVVGSNGGLTGYGGGLKNKKWLLDHERNAEGKKTPNASPFAHTLRIAQGLSQKYGHSLRELAK